MFNTTVKRSNAELVTFEDGNSLGIETPTRPTSAKLAAIPTAHQISKKYQAPKSSTNAPSRLLMKPYFAKASEVRASFCVAILFIGRSAA